jgi:prevent-host-death family protein
MVAPTNIAVEDVGPELFRLVESAGEGREIVITRAGQPVARIVPIPSSQARPKAGYGKGTVLRMADDFDKPLAEFDEDP